MFRYRVVGSVMGGNAKRIYSIMDLKTGEVFEEYANFFKRKGDDAFINVSVRETGFNILRADKGTEQNYKNYRGSNEKP